MREYNLYVNTGEAWHCYETEPVRIDKVTEDGQTIVVWEDEASELGAELERRTKAVPHSVYSRLVSCGMPEGATDAEQGQWFFEWLLKREAKAKRLQGIVDQLDHTQDGVPCVRGMSLYVRHPEHKTIICWTLTRDQQGVRLRSLEDADDYWDFRPEDCYSTHKAANTTGGD